VVYITVDGLGHTWAGGRSLLPESMVGMTSDRINATDVIWDFFHKHPGSVEDDEAAQHDGLGSFARGSAAGNCRSS